jgi:hypothetical protein
MVTTVFLLTSAAAGHPSQYVPGRSGGWPGWMAGPLEGLGAGIGNDSFQTLTLIMCASYVLVLCAARALPARALAAAIVAAYVILLLGPPLISQDVFGYLSFARLGALHSLDPYTHVAAEAPTDPIFPFIGWPFLHSPYGPLFTLASYATAPLGLAGGLWAFKAVAVTSSLGAVALIARAAGRLGQSPLWAAAVALVAGIGIKVTAGLVLPFLVLAQPGRRERLSVAATAGLSLLALAALGLIGFGAHALGFLSAVGEQQQLVATHSIPAETARLVGLSGTPTWWRHVFVGIFLAVLAGALWWTARGGDWRVAAGWTTLALLFSTAWLLPWYVIWALPLAAVSGNRRLRSATLIFCAYAVLIHLPLASPLLSPKRAHRHPVAGLHGGQRPVVAGHRVDLAGFKIPGYRAVDLRW